MKRQSRVIEIKNSNCPTFGSDSWGSRKLMMIRQRQSLYRQKFDEARREIEEAFPKYADTPKRQNVANGLAALTGPCYNQESSHG